MVNYEKKSQSFLSKTVQKGPSYASNRKETKYAAISFSNDKADEKISPSDAIIIGPQGDKHIQIEKVIS